MESVMKYKTHLGGIDTELKGQDWLKYWEKQTGEVADFCTEESCTNSATIGAHIYKVNSNDEKHYIVPFCHSCNQKKGAFKLWSTPTLVSIEITEPCG